MRLRSKLTYANVMVTLLAVVVLGGGAAYAATQLGKNTVGARQLKKNAVTGPKVKNGSLRAGDFAPGQLPAGQKGGEGPPGTSQGYEATGSVNFDKLSAVEFGSQVVSLDVPPGSYYATASAQAETVNGVATTVRCQLTGGLGAGATPELSQGVRADERADNFTLAAVFNVAKGQAISLDCSKEDAGSSARITNANLVAVQISGVTHMIG